MAIPGTLAGRDRDAQCHNERSAGHHHKRRRVPSAPGAVIVARDELGNDAGGGYRVVNAPGRGSRPIAAKSPTPQPSSTFNPDALADHRSSWEEGLHARDDTAASPEYNAIGWRNRCTGRFNLFPRYPRYRSD